MSNINKKAKHNPSGSSPVSRSNITQNTSVLNIAGEPCVRSVSVLILQAVTILSTTEMNPRKYPYKLCKLIIPHPGSKDQRWMIHFKVWHKQKRRLIIKREGDFNKNFLEWEVKEKKTWCRQRMKEIDDKLKEGFIIDEPPLVDEDEAEPRRAPGISITRVLDLGYKIACYDAEFRKKKTNRNIDTLRSIVKKFKEWLAENDLDHAEANEIIDSDAQDYLRYLLNEEGMAARSVDNQKSGLRTIFNKVMSSKEHKQILKVNAFAGIENIDKSIGRNIAYTPEQQKQIVEFMIENEPNILRLCLFMYHTLARTNEISWLRIHNVKQFADNKIFLPEEFTKNQNDRHMIITTELEQVINEMQLEQYGKDDFLFSYDADLAPGPIHRPSNKLGHIYRVRVLDKLGYTHDHSLYSWKHTGVVFALLAGVPEVNVFMQGGWKSWQSFQAYLKSLPLMKNDSFQINHPALLPPMRIA